MTGHTPQETTHSTIYRTLEKHLQRSTCRRLRRRSQNLRDRLFRAKLANNDNTPRPTAGTFRCNSRHGCLTSPYINHGKTSYTGETRQLKHHITCYSTNLTYIIQCNRCKKQYIGETKRTLRERFKEHRQATNNPLHANATAAVPSHFNQPGHSIADMELIPLDYNPLSACHAERPHR